VKWFKHISATHSDPDFMEAEMSYGASASYVFWRTLEILAKENSVDKPLKISEKVFKMYFPAIKTGTLWRVLGFFSYKRRINLLQMEGGYITIFCPKLLELSSTYTEKVRREFDQGSTNSDPKKKKKKEKKKKNILSTGGGEPPPKEKGLVFHDIDENTLWKRRQPISLAQNEEEYLSCCRWWFEKAPKSYYRSLDEDLECDSVQWAKKTYVWLENTGQRRKLMSKLLINFCKPKFKKE